MPFLSVCLRALICPAPRRTMLVMGALLLGSAALVPRAGWAQFGEPPTLGEMAGESISQIGEGLRQMRAEKVQFTREIAAARKRYWAEYPDGADVDAAKEAFSKALFQKDLYHQMMEIQDRGMREMGSSLVQVANRLTGTVDGGIWPEAKPEWDAWSAQHYLALTGGNFEQFIFSGKAWDADHWAQALQATQSYYEAYRTARDWEEFFASSHSPLRSGTLADKISVLLIRFGDATSMTEAAEMAATLQEALGEEVVQRAYERLAWDVKRLEGPYGGLGPEERPKRFNDYLLLHAANKARAYHVSLLAVDAGLTCTLQGRDCSVNAWIEGYAKHQAVVDQYGEAAVVSAADRVREAPSYADVIPGDTRGTALADFSGAPPRSPLDWIDALLRDPSTSLPSRTVPPGLAVDDDAALRAAHEESRPVTVRGVVSRIGWMEETPDKAAFILFFEGTDALVAYGGPDDHRDLLRERDWNVSTLVGATVEVRGVIHRTTDPGVGDGEWYAIPLGAQGGTLEIIDGGQPREEAPAAYQTLLSSSTEDPLGELVGFAGTTGEVLLGVSKRPPKQVRFRTSKRPHMLIRMEAEGSESVLWRAPDGNREVTAQLGPDGHVYGSFEGGESTREQGLFRLREDGTGFTVLRNFPTDEYHMEPYLLDVDDAGTLYGRFRKHQRFGIFRMNADGTNYHAVWHAPRECQQRCMVSTLVAGNDGFLYGVYAETSRDGRDQTTSIARLPVQGGEPEPIYTMDRDDLNPALVLGSDGDLYVLSLRPTDDDVGILLRVSRDGSRSKILHRILSPYAGTLPNAHLVEGPDERLYGIRPNRLFRIQRDGSGYETRPIGYTVEDLLVHQGGVYGIGTLGFENVLFRIDPGWVGAVEQPTPRTPGAQNAPGGAPTEGSVASDVPTGRAASAINPAVHGATLGGYDVTLNTHAGLVYFKDPARSGQTVAIYNARTHGWMQTEDSFDPATIPLDQLYQGDSSEAAPASPVEAEAPTAESGPNPSAAAPTVSSASALNAVPADAKINPDVHGTTVGGYDVTLNTHAGYAYFKDPNASGRTVAIYNYKAREWMRTAKDFAPSSVPLQALFVGGTPVEEDIPASGPAIEAVATATSKPAEAATPADAPEPVSQTVETACTQPPVFVAEEPPEMQQPVRHVLLSRRDHFEMADASLGRSRVFVQFVVGPAGQVLEPTVTRGSGHDLIDAAALRQIQETTFHPGRSRGVPVCVRMSLPVMVVVE